MIDRLLTNPALQYNTQASKRKDFPRVWKILAVPPAGCCWRCFTRAPSTRPGFPTSRELRLSERGGAHWFNASRHQPGSVEAHLGQDSRHTKIHVKVRKQASKGQ